MVDEAIPQKKGSSSPMGVVVGVIGGLTFVVTGSIVVGVFLRHRRRDVSEAVKEMTCESDWVDEAEEEDMPSEDYEGEIFDMEANGGGNESSRPGSRAEWERFAMHDGAGSYSEAFDMH
jgi:hypothetical protein